MTPSAWIPTILTPHELFSLNSSRGAIIGGNKSFEIRLMWVQITSLPFTMSFIFMSNNAYHLQTTVNNNFLRIIVKIECSMYLKCLVQSWHRVEGRIVAIKYIPHTPCCFSGNFYYLLFQVKNGRLLLKIKQVTQKKRENFQNMVMLVVKDKPKYVTFLRVYLSKN